MWKTKVWKHHSHGFSDLDEPLSTLKEESMCWTKTEIGNFPDLVLVSDCHTLYYFMPKGIEVSIIHHIKYFRCQSRQTKPFFHITPSKSIQPSGPLYSLPTPSKVDLVYNKAKRRTIWIGKKWYQRVIILFFNNFYLRIFLIISEWLLILIRNL